MKSDFKKILNLESAEIPLHIFLMGSYMKNHQIFVTYFSMAIAQVPILPLVYMRDWHYI